MPTIISYSSLRRTLEQDVDIPVPRRGGRNAGLQGFLPGQSSTASQLSLERISERIAEQTVVLPVSLGGLQDFRPKQVSSSSSHVPARDQEGLDEPGEGRFSHFSSWEKSAEVAGQVSARVPPHSSSWTPAAYEALSGSDEWVELYDDVKSKTYYWNRRTRLSSWLPPEGIMVYWVGTRDEEGDLCFWHRDTRASSYTLPPLPPE